MTIPSQSEGPPAFLREAATLRILVAEDPFICSFLKTILQRQGHEVVSGGVEQSVAALGSGSLKVQMVITNRPEDFLPFSDTLPVIYTAANPDHRLALLFRNCRILRKPFRNSELLEAVQDLSGAVLR